MILYDQKKYQWKPQPIQQYIQSDTLQDIGLPQDNIVQKRPFSTKKTSNSAMFLKNFLKSKVLE